MASLKDDFFGLIKTSFVIVVVYLVLRNATGATNILKAAGSTYVSGIKTLQGR